MGTHADKLAIDMTRLYAGTGRPTPLIANLDVSTRRMEIGGHKQGDDIRGGDTASIVNIELAIPDSGGGRISGISATDSCVNQFSCAYSGDSPCQLVIARHTAMPWTLNHDGVSR